MIGRHLIADFWLEKRSLLERLEPWEAILRAAAGAGRATPLSWQGHQFEPAGATGILLLSESHISVHTWPDAGFAALDIFTCGDIDPDLIFIHLFRQLQPAYVQLQFLLRGEETPHQRRTGQAIQQPEAGQP